MVDQPLYPHPRVLSTPRSHRIAVVAVFGLLSLASLGCGTTNLARPLDAGMTRVSFSLGGPAIQGVPLPSPETTIGAAHGVTNTFAVQAELHPTAAAVGVAGADVGFALHPIASRRALLGVGGTVYGFVNDRDNVVLGDGWLSSGTHLGEFFFLAGGAHLSGRVATSSRSVERQTALVPMVFAILGFRPGGQVEVQIEPRWYAFTERAPDSPVAVISPGGRGAFGILLGATYEFGKGIR